MANEIRGILFEVIARKALGLAIQKASIAGAVFWNEKPDRMSIKPDFTIGKDKNTPSHVILVTASGSAKETDKKFWRNIGELQEVKAQLPKLPIVINLYFKSIIKALLGSTSLQLYDSTIHVDSKSYYKPLEKWVKGSIKTASKVKTKEDRLALLETDIKADPSLAKAVNTLADDLVLCLKKEKKDLKPLWKLMQQDFKINSKKKSKTAKNTYIRRGLGKLSVLDQTARQIAYQAAVTKSISTTLPPYALDLGFFRKTIAGVELIDEEVRNAINVLGDKRCEQLVSTIPASIQPWINELRQLDNLQVLVNYTYDNFEILTNAGSLHGLLIQCHLDPQALAISEKIPLTGQTDRVWLFIFLMDLIKASTGKLQGYGYAQLAQDVGTYNEINSGYITIADWGNRKDDTILSTEITEGVANTLANRLKIIGKDNIKQLIEQLAKTSIKSLLEDRLIPYRNFEPLLWLIDNELKAAGKVYVAKTPHIGWINEYAKIGSKSATTPFVKCGSTLIHWKSSHTSHVHDKTKELSARARAIKYELLGGKSSFIRRTGVSKLALVIDGDFTDSNLETLKNSGWDIICYADEISTELIPYI